MTEDSSAKLNNGVFTSLFDENDRKKKSLPDSNSELLPFKAEVRNSGVTSDLDQAVAALECCKNTVLEHSSENITSLSSGHKLDHGLTKGVTPHGWTVSLDGSTLQHDGEETTKTRDFSELRAMFSQEGGDRQKMSTPRKCNSLDFTPVKERTLNLDGVDNEPLKTDNIISTNTISCEGKSDGDSLVSRMKKNFEAANSSETSVEKTPRNKKPVSFEVGLDYCVTRDSSSCSASHDPSRTQQTRTGILESETSQQVSNTETLNNSLVDVCPSIETLELNQPKLKKEGRLVNTGKSTDSPKSISFDISFDEKPLSKSVAPKTMAKPRKEKITDSKTTIEGSSSCDFIKVVDNVELVSEVETGLKGNLTADEKSITNNSYFFDVSFENDSPKKRTPREKLDVESSKTDTPPGEKISATRGVHIPVVGTDLGNEYLEDKANYANSSTERESVTSYNTPSLTDRPIVISSSKTAESTNEALKPENDAEKNEKEESKNAARGISFDVCFDDSIGKSKFNQKPKLTPKHIRLKMTKPKQRQNTKNNVQNDETAKLDSSISSSIEVTSKTKRIKQNMNERNTYTLDEVSNTLQMACEKGLTLEDALDDLAKHQETRNPKSSDTTLEATVSDGSAPTKRGTYSLDEVATCLVAAADKGLTVHEALDNLANSEEREEKTRINKSVIVVNEDASLNRGTYDLYDVAEKIDDEKDKGSSLEEALIQLLDEVESVVKETQKTSNRGTYDLKDVSKAVQEASDRGVSVEETLEKIATDNDTKNFDIVKQINVVDKNKKESSKEEYFAGENFFSEGNDSTETTVGKRGTYNLDDIESQLELVSDKGTSIVDTLSDISKPKPIKTFPIEASKVEETAATRNTYTLDEVAQSLELAKSKGIPIVQALSNISSEKTTDKLATPGSRGTYTLDEVAQSLETAREKGLPVVMALENLVLHDGGSLKGPADVAVHRRQGKLTNRKTYALASPLETIGEEKQLRLFDGTSRKLLPPSKDYVIELQQPQLYDDIENIAPSGQSSNVVQTLDLLTSACEALLKTTGKTKDLDKTVEEQPNPPQLPPKESREVRMQSKAESRDSGISFPSGPSERGTYTLDEVSETLEGAEKKGIPVVEALGSLTVKESLKKYRTPRALRKAGSKSESNLNKNTSTKKEGSRQTYSLDDVSSSVEAAKAKGIPVIAALDELTNSLAQFSATRTTPGKPLKKPDRPSIRKKEAARQDRSNVRSECGRESQKASGTSFPISYPPAMRNSYSLDDVASAFEKACRTGVPFENVLEAMQPGGGGTTQQSDGASVITKSTGSLKMGNGDLQSTTTYEDDSRKVHSALSLIKADGFSDQAKTDFSSYGKIPSSPPRKSSTSSEGSLTCSSSYGSDLSVNKDSSSTEELSCTSKVNSVRKQRRQSNGPFQLKRGRRKNSPANLRQLDKSPPPLQGDSVESLASRDSEASDASQSKRGTYDLKKVGDQLDSFKVQGVPVAKGLDKLVTNMSAKGKTSNEEIKDVQVIPKRGTYSLEDISKQLDSGKNQGDSVIHALDTLSSNPDLSSISVSNKLEIQRRSQATSEPDEDLAHGLCASEPLRDNYVTENKTRNTFTLDQVEGSIADATSRGVPVVQVLDKLSNMENPEHQDKTESRKPNTKPFVKPKSQKPEQDSFFIDYFPSKSKEGTKFKVENSEPVQVEEEKQTFSKHHDYPTRDGSSRKGPDIISSGRDINTTSEQTKLKEILADLSCTISDDFNKLAYLDNETSQDRTSEACNQKGEIENPTNLTQSILSRDQKLTLDEVKVSGSPNEALNLSRTRPRWQRSGSYMEALESFEEMIDSEQDVKASKKDQEETEGRDSIPVKESDYVNDKYETLHPESVRERTEISTRDRCVWRPSGTVLDKILNLMDDAEERGLSIADALEQAAEMSEQQDEITEVPKIDEAKVLNSEERHRRSEEQLESQRDNPDLERVEGLGNLRHEFSSGNGTVCKSRNAFGYQGNQVHGYQAESTEYSLNVTTLRDEFPPVTTIKDKLPLHQDFNNWEANNLTVPPSVTGFAPPSSEGNIDRDESRTGAKSRGYDDVIEDEESSPKKVFSIFISDESDKTKEQGLTPEQQRKRNRFLRSRQKKLEEEKARRESENEKKRQHETRQQEAEAQKRVRHINQQEQQPTLVEYKSPPRITRSSGKSNRKMIMNALTHACLSGAVNNENRERCLQAMSESQGFHFIILLKDGLRFRGLHVYDPENNQCYRIYGTGPKIISSNMIDCVYKYNSSSKEFVKIPSKTLSISVDGVAINKIYWQSNKPNVASKTQSNLKRFPRPPQR